jgi:hypothetical protein
MEEVWFSEILVSYLITTQRHNTETAVFISVKALSDELILYIYMNVTAYVENRLEILGFLSFIGGIYVRSFFKFLVG